VGVGFEKRALPCQDSWGRQGRGEGQDVVFGDVVGFVAVEGAGAVDDGCVIAFVSSRYASASPTFIAVDVLMAGYPK